MKKGIDVSSHQKNIDWAKVKSSGIEFAIIRIGYGMYDNQKDAYFETNYKNAKANGIKVGTYTYSYAKTTSEAVKEAECVIRWLNGKKLDLPVYFDLEDNSQKNLGKATLNAMCGAFCEKIKSAGYTAGVYANKYWSTSLFDGNSIAQKYSFWVAQYNSECTYKGKYDIWQYSSSGNVNGINGNCDMDYMYSEISGGSSNPTTKKPTCTGNITYQSYDNSKKQWLPEVVNDKGYAGNIGNSMGGVRAKCKNGKIYMITHIKGGNWLSAINSGTYSKGSNSGNSYSGIIGKSIDGVKIWSDYGYVSYRVHLKNGKWLDWVHKADNTNNGYAGILGKEIDAIQMR